MTRVRFWVALALTVSFGCRDPGPDVPALEKLEIITDALPSGIAGRPYQTSITAKGGAVPYVWSIDGAPAGIALAPEGSPATSLFGTPDASGTYAFTVTVADAAGASASRAYTLTIEPAGEPIEIATLLLPDGVVGLPYRAELEVRESSGSVEWSIERGELPPGLVLDPSGDPHTTLTGTPTASGDFTFAVHALDAAGAADTQEYTIRISETFVPIAIETSTIPVAFAGIPYQATIVARYGTGRDFAWSVSDGALPPGLDLSAAGTPAATIDGTATATGTFTATITVRDSNGDEASRAFDFTVRAPPLTITTESLPDGDLDVTYQATLVAIGGTGTGHSWRVSAGSLPPGLFLDDATIRGTPTLPGSYDFTIEVTDSGGAIATRDYTIAIHPPVEIVTASLPDAVAGASYSTSLVAQGGSGAHTFQLTAGALPPGLALSIDGVISGVPNAIGDHSFTVTASDPRGSSGARDLSITVIGPTVLTVLTTSLPGAGAGVAYTATITAAGGTGAGYVWSIDGGALPPGLTIAENGTPTTSITGTTNALGTHNFTVRVTDNSGATATRALAIEVLPALQIVTASLPARVECAPRRDTITASGGSGTGYRWSLVSGAPPGLVIDPEGTPSTVLHGRPTAAGAFATTIRVRDSAGLVAERTIDISVTADPGAQRHLIQIGDLVREGDTEVFLTDVCGDRPSGLIALNPPAPGTGDASLDPKDARFSPDLARIAFIGDFITDGVDELFISTAADPTVRRRINGPLTAGGEVHDFFWSPDSTLIAYLADQNTDGVNELFVVDVSNPAMPFFPVRVNSPLSGGSDVTDVVWAPDSNGLVYRADPTDGVFELFFVNLAIPTAPGTPARLHPPLSAPRSCDADVVWSPSGTSLLHRCDAATAGVFELWFVRFSGGVPQAAQRANGSLVANGDVQPGAFAFSPDGAAIVYLADQNVDEVVELYVAIAFGGLVPGVRAMSPLAANEDITAFRFAPSGFRGILRADLDTNDVFELYLLDASGGFPASPIRLSGNMVAGGDVDPNAFGFSPDGTRVAYLADQIVNDHPELFVVDVTGSPGSPMRVSPALGVPPGTSVDSFAFSADSRRIAMLGDFFVPDQIELAVFTFSGASLQLVNTPLPPGGDVTHFEWRRDGNGIFFRADLIADDEFELWSVDLFGPSPGEPLRAHPLAPSGGDVELFSLEP